MAQKSTFHFEADRPTIKQRMEAGKKLRAKCRRISLGTYKKPANRKDPISILEAQAKTRLPELVPIRHARMLTSSFAFYRGNAGIMTADLAAQTHLSGIEVQACGDMHLANFGVFASAERNLVFGINDFDETHRGPWEWDLQRLVASIVSGGKFLGADKELCEKGVRSAVTTYRKKMREFAQMGNLELWYSTIKEDDILAALNSSAREGAKKIFSKARTRTHMQVLGKMTDLVDEKYRLKEDAPFIVRPTHASDGTPITVALANFLESYLPTLNEDRLQLLKRYRVVDVARKIVGVGSVGTRCWVVFLQGSHEDDPLFLQVKEAQKSVLSPYTKKSAYAHQGQRVVSGQRLIQGAPDIFLGWGNVKGVEFYVRQLRDMKGGVEFDPEKIKIENLPQYTSLCGWALAQAHAKSTDAALLAGYVGNSEELDDAMVKFAFAYNVQTEKDYALFEKAIGTGRLQSAGAEKVEE
ncbi:MAG TPA: DUF2252 domain-containing protein [Chitinophagaceae bacterium]|nr:DUF2252 domain-containing protein [Chitinophagaceae bacterium]